jgi:hypothetical protein
MNKKLKKAIKLIGNKFPDQEIINIYRANKEDFPDGGVYEFALDDGESDFHDVGLIFVKSKIITMR